MSVIDELNADLKEAMKAKDSQKLSVIRMVKSSLSNEQISLGHELTEDEELGILSREVKQRNESLAEYKKGNREDLASQTQNELDILAKYLPAQLSEQEIQEIIAEAIAETGANSPKDMGKVMQIVSAKTKGRADGKTVSQQVQSALK